MLNESEVKYLAGLLDADGSLSIKDRPTKDGKYYVDLLMEISAAKGYDRKGYLNSLSNTIGSCNIKSYSNPKHQDTYVFRIQSRKDLNIFLPRVTKHMVIKGAHWKRLYDKYCELKGVKVSHEELTALKRWSSLSRKMTGPIKPKNHITWAWAAGYFDGDGSYQLPKSGTVLIQVKAHVDDVVGLELLKKSLGGNIYKPTSENCKVWQITMGKMNKSRALRVLPKLHRHSRFKQWKIEQMIAFHHGTATTN